jgi:hypothetical protein
VGAIAKELGIHHSVVTRVLDRVGLVREVERRPSRLDEFLPFIKDVLERYPKITASRLFGMVKERGYVGHPDHFRHAIQKRNRSGVGEGLGLDDRVVGGRRRGALKKKTEHPPLVPLTDP